MRASKPIIITAWIASAAATAILAGLAIHYWPGLDGPADLTPPRAPLGSLTHDQTATSQPDEAIGLPGADGRPPDGSGLVEALSGVTRLEGDPVGLPVPPGAQRVEATRMVLPDCVSERAVYLANTSSDELQSFYDKALSGGQWRRRLGASGGVLYASPQRRVWLKLTAQGAGRTRVAVVVTRQK